MASEELVCCDFEVLDASGVSLFRRAAHEQANLLGVTGWIKRHSRTLMLTGHLEGPASKIEEMKKWLEFTGSPGSQIEKATFTENQPVASPEYETFQIL